MKFLVLLLITLLLGVPSPALASTTPAWADDFSQDELHNWQEVQNTQHGKPDAPCRSAEVDRFTWQVGDHSAMLDIQEATPCSITIIPLEDALQDLPAFAVTFTMEITSPQQDRNWMLQWQDSDNYLGFHLFDNVIYLEKKVNGIGQYLGNNLVYPFKQGEKYFIRLEYDRSTRAVRVYINHELIGERQEPPGQVQLLLGRPGLSGSVGAGVSSSQVRYDDFAVWQLGEAMQLEVPLFRQNDLSWAEKEYDHASRWSSTKIGIENWGCALTAGVMVLQAHGIQELHTGQPLTPESVNHWLRSELDGYVGAGLVNWRALSRLTYELAELQSTPILEYSRASPPEQEKIPWLKEKLRLGIPVILEQPGHYIVATGYGPGQNQIAIHDPYYSRTSLSEYGNTYLSARVFTPSYTDLSSIVVSAPLHLKLRFFDQDRQIFPDQIVIESPLRDPFTGRLSGESFVRYEFISPKDQELRLQVYSGATAASQVLVQTYQQNGEVQQKNWLVAEGDQQEMEVIYQKNGITQFSVQGSIEIKLHNALLARWLREGKIFSPFLLEKIPLWQEKIIQTERLEQAEALYHAIQLQLSAYIKHGWILASTAQLLEHFFLLLIHEKFP